MALPISIDTGLTSMTCWGINNVGKLLNIFISTGVSYAIDTVNEEVLATAQWEL